MSKCEICGPDFTSRCPHELPLRIMIEAVLAWRSDDFGHDTQSLLEAESRALQDIGEKFLDLIDQIDLITRRG